MKNIIVVDIYANLVPSIIANSNLNIALGVFDDANITQKVKIHFGDKIANYYHRMPETISEFNSLHESDYNLTYDEIEKFRFAQLKVEKFLQRELYDEASIEARYFTALKYFLDFFDKNKIDFILSAHLEHGAIWDSLIFDIAKSKSIPVFLISAVTANGNKELNCITERNSQTLIELDSLIGKANFDTDDFFKRLNNYYLSMKKQSKPKIKVVENFFNVLRYLLVSIKEGFIGFNSKDLKMNNKYYTQINFQQDETTKQKIYIKNLLNSYKVLSVQPNYGDKYIFYPLHQEPEASISVRAIMSNQLFIIEQISKYLPKGYYLYVKEHPSEFYIYKSAQYFYKNINYFRTIHFYKKIKELKNVKLISLDAPTPELMKNAIAINSITGTALLESVMLKKPIIIWGYGINVLEKLNDSFSIDSIDSLRYALEAIASGFKPNYDELDKLVQNFTFYAPSYGTKDWLEENLLYADILKLLCRMT